MTKIQSGMVKYGANLNNELSSDCDLGGGGVYTYSYVYIQSLSEV